MRKYMYALVGAILWPFVVSYVAFGMIFFSGNVDYWPASVFWPVYATSYAGVLLLPIALTAIIGRRRPSSAAVWCL
jgi:hypothetical protein